ncbi:MAG TPA: hypothetical protein VF516_02010, partial [Kofleriaceae bacterium]
MDPADRSRGRRGLQTAAFELDPPSGPALFTISGIGLVASATWLPHGESFRLAAALDGAIDGGLVEADACDPDNCMGYILPARARTPARLVAGAAYRWAPTAWNQQVTGPFRDELSLTLAGDIVVTGPTASGAGVEAFGMHELQPSVATPWSACAAAWPSSACRAGCGCAAARTG